MMPAHRSTIRHRDADTHIGSADDLARLDQILQVPIVAEISVMGLLSQDLNNALESCEPRSIVPCQLSTFIVDLTEACMNFEEVTRHQCPRLSSLTDKNSPMSAVLSVLRRVDLAALSECGALLEA